MGYRDCWYLIYLTSFLLFIVSATPQDDGLCGIITATNISSQVGSSYSSWSCSPTGLTSTDPCNFTSPWQGVNCTLGVVTSLVLPPSTIIQGTLPGSIGCLTGLTYLDINFNYFCTCNIVVLCFLVLFFRVLSW